jgi:putative membrane protein
MLGIRHLAQRILMKNTFTIISRFGMALAVGSLCFVGTATGQDLRPIKPKAEESPPPPEAGPTAEKTKKGGNLSAEDKSFMMKAAKGGMMEVEWGKLAAQNAQSADVKKFGNRMVADHSKANEELMALAQEEGVKLPSEKAGGKWKSDKDYMDMMVKDHEKDLAEFESEAKDGSDADLKKFADKTSKVVKKHLDMAKEIQGKLT